MHIFSAYPQPPHPELLLEMIYQEEMEVGKEEALQTVVRNIGTAIASNITVDFNAPAGAFNITLVKRIGPDDLSPLHNMSILFKITPLKPGNFTIEPTLTYFDQKGQDYQTPWEPFNINVNPASPSPLDYLGSVVILIAALCLFGIIFLAIRKRLEHYFPKPR
jgi:uncharacterized membrane protein